MSSLTTAQIKVIAFNAVGRGAETRNESPFELGFADKNKESGKSGIEATLIS